VDGTLLEAWASHKSFTPKEGSPPPTVSGGRNSEVDFRGRPRSNRTHRSTTDPEALLARKSDAAPAKLCYAGHVLMEHRSALIVDMELTQADGRAEREAAAQMLGRLPKRKRRRTVAADKAYDTTGFVASCRTLGITAHVAQNTTNAAAPSITARPATRATPSASGSASASRSRSGGSRPSPAAASSGTRAAGETERGS